MFRRILPAALFFLMPAVVFADSEAIDIIPLDSAKDGGKQTATEIVSISEKEVLVRLNPEMVKSFEPLKLASIEYPSRSPQPPGGKIEVEFVDGSHYHCANVAMKGKDLFLTLHDGLVMKVPASVVFYMAKDLQEPKTNQAFRNLLGKRGKFDLWVVPRGDTLDGINGTFGDADEMGNEIEFSPETGKKVNIKQAKLFGLIFNQTPTEQAQTLCRVVDIYSNVSYAKSVQLADGKVKIVTTTNASLEYPSLGSIKQFDFGAGAQKYLSDLEPVKLEESSIDGSIEHYRRDRNLDNGPLAFGQKQFTRGLAIHSRTVLMYDIGRKYTTFETIAATDDCVSGDSTVILSILADNQPVFKQKIHKGDKPLPVKLNVNGVGKLQIVVESEFLDLGNQIDLADAKLMK